MPIERGPRFSFYKAPITNKYPHKSITIRDAYNYIVGPYAAKQTKELRSITDKKKACIYKAANFAYATFCGEFEKRGNDDIKTVSNLLCIDFDHVTDIEGLFTRLLNDQFFETALLFRSPSGDGLKWVIEINTGGLAHSQFFKAIESYILKTYGIPADPSGKDISRACFLPYDPAAFINENY
ncbi:MAG: virulence protein E [Bacteroidales bacterium]|nr:virulence protein E [Bacteroidales bacterium]